MPGGLQAEISAEAPGRLPRKDCRVTTSECQPKATPSYTLSVAPMMDWTDRHCRLFHRQFTRRTLLYTEMVTAAALLHGPVERLLAHDPQEYPLALQLGGSDPGDLAAAVALARGRGFEEINLNVGCPSDRVQSGCFGAALMREPALVAECVAAMIGAAGDVPITVKCRIGVDQQEPTRILPQFLETVAAAGVQRVAIHARKAWLQGLSPKENRTIPPLDYPLVVAMKRAFPGLTLVVNGGIASLDEARAFVGQGLDGAMIGRAAYSNPSMLGTADQVIFGEAAPGVVAEQAVRAMLPHIEAERGRGTPLAAITRHMLGAFAGRPGARAWRRLLSEEAHTPQAGPELIERGLALVGLAREAA